MQGDAFPLVLSYAYFIGVLAAAEGAHRRLGVPAALTRPAVQVAVGMWSVPIVLLFTSWQWGILAPATLALFHYVSYRFVLLRSVEKYSPGSVLLPLSMALLLAVLWRPGAPGEDQGYVAVGGLMAVTWGDPMASYFGRRHGRRRYRVLGHPRTMEGTLAFFFAASVAIAPVLGLLGGLDVHPALALAMIAATVAASVEAVSPYGTDNFTVPVATAGALYVLAGLLQ